MVEFDVPKGYTKKEKRQCFYLNQLSELNDVPTFLIRELARQEDVETVATIKPKPAGSLTDRNRRMGPHARARYNTSDAFHYRVKEILHDAKENTAHLPKLDKKKQ